MQSSIVWRSGVLHPSEESLASFVYNDVVGAHLNACPPCREKSEIYLDLMLTLGASLR